MREVYLLTSDQRRNVAGDLAHPVAFVACPVCERDVADPAAAGVSGQRTQQEIISARREKTEIVRTRYRNQQNLRRPQATSMSPRTSEPAPETSQG